MNNRKSTDEFNTHEDETLKCVSGYNESLQAARDLTAQQREAISNVCTALTNELGRPLQLLLIGNNGTPASKLDLDPGHDKAYITRMDLQAVVATQKTGYDLVVALGLFDTISTDTTSYQALQRAGAATIFDSNASIQHPALQAFPFIHEIAPGSLQEDAQQATLYFGSAQYWYLNDKAEAFTSWKDKSQCYVGDLFEKSRRYYFNKHHFVKLFTRTGRYAKINIFDIAQEANFLTAHRNILSEVPRLVAVRANQQEAWLLRERIPGELLLDVMLSEEVYDPIRILREVLCQLVALERHNLYHSDLRIWNVVLRKDGYPILIDYAAIIDKPEDCNWLNNIFLSFWIFVWCVSTRNAHPGTPQLPPRFSPEHLPQAYQTWSKRFWARPAHEWSFADLLASFDMTASR